MTISERIEADITTAMKAREQERLDALRMVRAALKNEVIALGHELSDDEAIKVLQRQVKQRQDAAEQYRAAGRQDAATKEDTEKAIIAEFLPAQMGDAELKMIVEEAIATTNAAGAADMGKVIGAVRAKVGSSADGSRIAAMVKEKLSA